jgi:signal transduction histidine kinase/CheY-like chemotaxis protein
MSGDIKIENDPTPDQIASLASSAEQLAAINELGVEQTAFIPLKVHGRILGVLSLFSSTRTRRRFSNESLILILEIARRSAFAIENARLYREAQFANRAKDEFLATISHELRTPMNVILGWLEILATEPADHATFEMAVTTLTRNARVQIQLINDLLDISRIISGKLSIDVKDADLASVARLSIDSLLPAAQAKGITLRVLVPPTPVRLSFDTDRIQQILWNLLSNAVKFTPEGGRIDLVLIELEDSVKIEVHDTGQGIDARFLPYVFDRFRQEDGSTTRTQGGLGLGLAISRYLTELHGGSITAHSEGRNLGSRFTITFPKTGATKNHQMASSQPPLQLENFPDFDSDLSELKGRRVLLIDDSLDVRTLISRILVRAGLDVMAVDSAEAGFKALTEHRPDFVLSDIGLPHEDGLSLIQRIRSYELEHALTPVPAAALTAYAQESDIRKILLSGFDQHIAKPVSATSLLYAIHTLMLPSKPQLKLNHSSALAASL